MAAVAERLRNELHMDALAIELWRPGGQVRRFSAGNAPALQDTQARTGGSTRVLQAGHGPSDGRHAAPGRWVRVVQPTRASATHTDVDIVPVRVSDRRLGALLFAHGNAPFTETEDPGRGTPHGA